MTRPIIPGTAEISADGLYRYWLTRMLGGDSRPLVVCGLNPSTADAVEPDNTIDKEIKFARSWGCDSLAKVNMYGYRETKPALMWKWAAAGGDIVGPENDAWILRAVDLVEKQNGIFLGAWGNHAKPDRVRHVVENLIAGRVPIYCIKSNKNGSPIHPLYQKDNSQPVIWRAAA